MITYISLLITFLITCFNSVLCMQQKGVHQHHGKRITLSKLIDEVRASKYRNKKKDVVTFSKLYLLNKIELYKEYMRKGKKKFQYLTPKHDVLELLHSNRDPGPYVVVSLLNPQLISY